MKRRLRYLFLFISLWCSCTFVVTIVAFPRIFVDNIGLLEELGITRRSRVSLYKNETSLTLIHRHKAKIYKPTTVKGTVELSTHTVTLNEFSEEISTEMSRFDLEKIYFTPRKTKINTLNAKFVIVNRKFCEDTVPYLLVIVPSLHRNAEVRNAIRNSYGFKSFWKLDNQRQTVTVKLMFLFGRSTKQLDLDILQESRKYGDIIQADFVDSYSNLTRKILYGLKWISTYCSEVEFVVKADEDVFLNIPELSKYLIKTPYDMKGAIYGYINKDSSVKRMGKWKVTVDQYPLKQYPDYASGNSYVISGNIVPRLFMVSEYMPYMPIEDAFITGCLAKIVGATHLHNTGFTQWISQAPDPCTFVRDGKISATKVTMSLFVKIWDAIRSYPKVCG